ncbi:MAG: LytTR family DNA-binding domain-containing protein [Duncaniella sp.]|nr:LytTR family DNA-binding domain-containing protein [Duncaniella sp.]MDE7144774.1 LytTR family DNA-binding domain-containing protein [Duncaniella sp.]
MIKCVAIDDEPIALSIIGEYCKKYGDIDYHSFTSPIAGMEYVLNTLPDIVFLDIELNSHNGIELARRLPPGTCVIFTTAYSQYALDGFNVDAIDFLHKPIFYPRFQHAIEKALFWLGRRKEENTPKRETITLKVEHKTVVIDLNDIILIEAMDNYIKVFRENMPMILSQITMKEIESILPEDRFIRVHRSFIIALDSIEKFSNRKIFFTKLNRQIPVGRKYIQTFNKLYDIFKLTKPTKQ